MRRDEALRIIRAHEAELRAMGVESVELFGSVARDEAGPESDVDVLVRFDERTRPKGLAYFGLRERVRELIERSIGREVDLTSVPQANGRFARAIAEDRTFAF